MVILVVGSPLHIDLIKLMISSEYGVADLGCTLGISMIPILISCSSSRMFVALKGILPHTIAYKRTPRLQMSDIKPLKPFSENDSGDMYGGVPDFSTISKFGSLIS